MNPAEAWSRRKADLEERIRDLRSGLHLAEGELKLHIENEPTPLPPAVESSLSQDDKIRLFRERFVGRNGSEGTSSGEVGCRSLSTDP